MSENRSTLESETHDREIGPANAPGNVNNNGGTKPNDINQDAPSKLDDTESKNEGEEKTVDPRKRVAIGTLIVIAVIIALILGIRYYKYSITHVSTDDAYTTGNLVNISPIVSGNLSELTVQEGDYVAKGQVIAKLDDQGPESDVLRAKSAYDAALSEVPQAQISLVYQREATDAAIQKAQAELAAQNAKTSGAVQQVALSQATTLNQVRQADSQVAQAQAQAASSAAQVKTALAGIAAQQQAVITAQRAANAAAANIAAAKANNSKELADEVRYRKLLAQDAVTQQQYDVVHAAMIGAQSQLESIMQQADQAQSAVQQAREAVTQAKAQYDAAQSQYEAVSEQISVAKAGLGVARANLSQVPIQQSNAANNQQQGSSAQADLAAARAGEQEVELKQKEIATSAAQAESAKAQLVNAQVLENDTVITAPIDGYVVRKGVNIGAALSPGQTIATMTAGGDLWVEANYKETQLQHVQPGEPAEVRVDQFPGKIFHGVVQSITAATGASTSLLPPDNATGNFTKVVQRVPVRIKLVPAKSDERSEYARADDIRRLGQGLSVTAIIDTSGH